MSDETNMTDNQDRPKLSPDSQPVLAFLRDELNNWQDREPDNKELIEQMAEDFLKRTELGIRKYGLPLYSFNGRNAYLDLYMELLDACQYQGQIALENTNAANLYQLYSLLRTASRVKANLIEQGIEIYGIKGAS